MAEPLSCGRIYDHARYTAFYDLELGNFSEDLAFYRRHLPDPGCAVLELGCGTGRVSRALAADGHRLTGIDLSLPMLAAAAQASTVAGPLYACMDMTALALRTPFAAIIAPYNTLNLLIDPEGLRACLGQVRQLLADQGVFLAQIYIPDRDLRALKGKKRFQFRIFDRPDGSKVIKETWKNMAPESTLVEIREQYRLRFAKDHPNEDWQYTYRIIGQGYEQWLDFFADQGFVLEAVYGDYALAPFVPDQHTTLLLALRKGGGEPE